MDDLDCSAAARQRLRVILESMTGGMSIEEACRALGLRRSRFHALRRQFLAEAGALLEPRAPGRRAREATPAECEAAALREEVVRLKLELNAMQVREELALVMPHLFRGAKATHGSEGKKGARRRRRR